MECGKSGMNREANVILALNNLGEHGIGVDDMHLAHESWLNCSKLKCFIATTQNQRIDINSHAVSFGMQVGENVGANVPYVQLQATIESHI